jgi:hypothetical protein
MSTNDPEPPAAGNVLDVPVNRPGTDLEPAAEVLDAEIVDETTLVDQPQSTDNDDRPLAVRLAELTKARRPILASWLRSWTALLGVIRWAATHTGHIVAFHAVRVPIYAGTLLLRSPRGLLRVIANRCRRPNASGTSCRAQGPGRLPQAQDSSATRPVLDSRSRGLRGCRSGAGPGRSCAHSGATRRRRRVGRRAGMDRNPDRQASTGSGRGDAQGGATHQ